MQTIAKTVRVLLLPVLLVVLFGSCVENNPRRPEETTTPTSPPVEAVSATTGLTWPADPRDIAITLSRTECRGWCPNYQVVVYGNGWVIYQGRSFVREIGERLGEIPAEDVHRLLQQFTDADFFELKDEYVVPATDLSTVYLTLRIGGRQKKVLNYWPGPGFDADGQERENLQVHLLLDSLAESVDRTVDIEQWIGLASQRFGLFSGTRGSPGSTRTRDHTAAPKKR